MFSVGWFVSANFPLPSFPLSMAGCAIDGHLPYHWTTNLTWLVADCAKRRVTSQNSAHAPWSPSHDLLGFSRTRAEVGKRPNWRGWEIFNCWVATAHGGRTSGRLTRRKNLQRLMRIVSAGGTWPYCDAMMARLLTDDSSAIIGTPAVINDTKRPIVSRPFWDLYSTNNPIIFHGFHRKVMSLAVVWLSQAWPFIFHPTFVYFF